MQDNYNQLTFLEGIAIVIVATLLATGVTYLIGL